jgi:cysteinyl-tRNA synthetase
MITLYNTLTKKVEEFKPINSDKVLLYTCGPTVYNYLHVGNWVAYIRWDILVRMLQASGYDVVRVMNITDVGHLVSDADDGEDKMEKGAKREGKTAWEIAKLYTDDFLQGMNKLNLIEPTFITKATEYIPQQIDLIQKLKSKGYTYQITDGIYFDTAKFSDYSKFANLQLDELKSGARVEYNPEKHNPSDFALWKFSPLTQKRDMEWDTPVEILEDNTPRKGFPGWHLECSAMAMDKLGETIDIHTGGIDHIPVHHTNEIAQSEAASGKTFSNYWLHNNFLLIDGTKVSKSLGNTYELKDLELKGFNPDDFRMFVLQSNYRSESNFTWDNMQAAHNRLSNWKQIACLQWQDSNTNEQSDKDIFINAINSILKALQNDLDTPSALIAAENALNHADQKGISPQSLGSFVKFLDSIESLLGLNIKSDGLNDQQKKLLVERIDARINKDFNTSDIIRDALEKQGIIVKDSPLGQIWHRK